MNMIKGFWFELNGIEDGIEMFNLCGWFKIYFKSGKDDK